MTYKTINSTLPIHYYEEDGDIHYWVGSHFQIDSGTDPIIMGKTEFENSDKVNLCKDYFSFLPKMRKELVDKFGFRETSTDTFIRKLNNRFRVKVNIHEDKGLIEHFEVTKEYRHYHMPYAPYRYSPKFYEEIISHKGVNLDTDIHTYFEGINHLKVESTPDKNGMLRYENEYGDVFIYKNIFKYPEPYTIAKYVDEKLHEVRKFQPLLDTINFLFSHENCI